ncbi:hypothetical protein [Clostridium sp. JS66]|nr:hypothetical protein [Clostridium sp. JS66]WPC39824.1 hypothetical protein Q6H37_18115 [Clostridium sp. JS66]
MDFKNIAIKSTNGFSAENTSNAKQPFTLDKNVSNSAITINK